MKKEKRAVARDGILANFRFFIDDTSEKSSEGITTNVSLHGFGFLTGAPVKEGQILTITEHSISDFSGRRASVVWVKKGPRYFEAGAEFISEG
jgi:PilZ domain